MVSGSYGVNDETYRTRAKFQHWKWIDDIPMNEVYLILNGVQSHTYIYTKLTNSFVLIQHLAISSRAKLPTINGYTHKHASSFFINVNSWRKPGHLWNELSDLQHNSHNINLMGGWYKHNMATQVNVDTNIIWIHIIVFGIQCLHSLYIGFGFICL